MENTAFVVIALIALLANFSLFFIILLQAARLTSRKSPATSRKKAVLSAVGLAGPIALVIGYAVQTMSTSSGVLLAILTTVAAGIVVYFAAPFMMQ